MEWLQGSTPIPNWLILWLLVDVLVLWISRVARAVRLMLREQAGGTVGIFYYLFVVLPAVGIACLIHSYQARTIRKKHAWLKYLHDVQKQFGK